MTTSDYTVGPGRPPLHSRFQKGRSGNPGGRPGPAKQLKQRFYRALREALEKTPQELEAARPTDMLSSFARNLAPDGVAGRGVAPRLLLTILDRDSGEKQDLVERLIEAEHGVAPAFGEGPKAASPVDAFNALFSLSEGESQGENRRRMQEILKMLDEIAPGRKQQGGSRENSGVPATEEV